jgi:hypothetical protein
MTQAFGQALGLMDFASPIGQDRLVRKEVMLGFIREVEPPQDHKGLAIAPFLDVPTDDVVFGYLKGMTSGLAPARAEDAESELAQKDDMSYGEGRASTIDWTVKDHYTASDVNRYREMRAVAEQLAGGELPLFARSALQDWATKFTRDASRRRKMLDNRIELMIMTSVSDGVLAYNDGKIKFTVDWGRPLAQQAGNAANVIAGHVTNGVWDLTGVTHDPIGFINALNDKFFDMYGFRFTRALTSRKVLNQIVNSQKFSQRAGLGFAVNANGTGTAPDLNYLANGWGRDSAISIVEQATGVTFIETDGVYRTRPVGSKVITNTRFFPINRIVFLPNDEDLSDVDDTGIGFAKTLTSPHPESNWNTGFYEWEKEERDPWGMDAGTGIKAFPVFPFMEFTYAVNVALPA